MKHQVCEMFQRLNERVKIEEEIKTESESLRKELTSSVVHCPRNPQDLVSSLGDQHDFLV